MPRQPPRATLRPLAVRFPRYFAGPIFVMIGPATRRVATHRESPDNPRQNRGDYRLDDQDGFPDLRRRACHFHDRQRLGHRLRHQLDRRPRIKKSALRRPFRYARRYLLGSAARRRLWGRRRSGNLPRTARTPFRRRSSGLLRTARTTPRGGLRGSSLFASGLLRRSLGSSSLLRPTGATLRGGLGGSSFLASSLFRCGFFTSRFLRCGGLLGSTFFTGGLLRGSGLGSGLLRTPSTLLGSSLFTSRFLWGSSGFRCRFLGGSLFGSRLLRRFASGCLHSHWLCRKLLGRGFVCAHQSILLVMARPVSHRNVAVIGCERNVASTASGEHRTKHGSVSPRTKERNRRCPA